MNNDNWFRDFNYILMGILICIKISSSCFPYYFLVNQIVETDQVVRYAFTIQETNFQENKNCN